MLRQIEHPYIIRYYSLYKPSNTDCSNSFIHGLMMEYMPGGSLSTYIEESHHNISLSDMKLIIK